MLNAIIESSLNNRFLVLMATALVAGLGVYSAVNLPIDAVPDLTNVQVQVITEAPALSPLEVESLLSFPVEGAMSGLPNVEQIRSISKFGISVVTVVFEEGTDIYRARQLVGERLSRAAEAIPAGYGTPTLGPIATALGEVFQFQVKASAESKLTPMELRTLLDWYIAYQLRKVPGVTEINAHGGELKTYQVEVDPDKLGSYRLSMTDVFNALKNNNANVGGGYLIHEGEARYIRGVSQARSVDDISAIVIDERNGVPVTIGNVANVHPAPMIRAGLATRDGEGEIVTGLVMMLIGQNGRKVVTDVKAEIAEIQKSLPPGVTIEPLYDRTHLINQTLSTVLHNLVAGGILVIVVLLAMLGNLRGGLIVAMAIPLSMLFAANIMLATGLSASLMSLGAIDFGLIVDSSVIMVENCVRRLAHEGGTRSKLDIVRDAAIEVRKPTMFGELIIAIVYLPILALQDTEGKLFRPMALTVIFALAGSLVLSLSFMPVMASLGLNDRAEEKELWLIRWIKRLYTPVLDLFMRHPFIAVILAAALVITSVPIAWNMGAEFMPRLNEGDLLIEAVRIPSVSLEGAVPMSTQIERLLKTIPEVRVVYCKTGRPEIANDVMGVHQTDVWTLLKPQDQWRPGLTRDELIEEMDRLLSDNVPGVKFGFSQPIEMRVNELVAGVKSDVAILIYGPDLEVLRQIAQEVERVLARIPGAHDIKVPSAGRLPMLRINVRRDQLARYGIKASDVLDAVSALGGTTVGTVFEGQKRFRLQVRLPEIMAERRREDRLDPDRRYPGPADRTEGPCRHLARGRAQRGRTRERPAAGLRGCECSGTRHCGIRGRGPGRHRIASRAAPRLHVPLGRPVRAPRDGLAQAGHRGSRGHAPDLPPALQHVPLDAAGLSDLPGRAHGGHRRRVRPDPPRASVLDLGGGRLHRAVRRGRAQRPGLGQRRRAPETGRHRPLRGRARGRHRPAPADPHDRPGRRPGIHPHGPGHDSRRRDPAAAGHGRHRRPVHLDHADLAGSAGHLSLVRPQAQGG